MDSQKNALCLCVDVGNTVTSFGVFDASSGEKSAPLATWELTTPARLTMDEASMQVSQLLGPSPFGGRPVEAILSCVVPSLVDPWSRGLAKLCDARPVVVGPGVKTGMSTRYKDPAEIGSDRIADALAARTSVGAPAVVIDLGTTLNIEVVDGDGMFLGGIIAPGFALGARALRDAAARLPMIELKAPKRAIGRSTREAMQSGVVFGEIARVDGLLERVFAELGQDAPVIVTGDNAAAVASLLAHPCTVDQTLTLRGLHQLWMHNKRK